jgi:hypothetical protein
MALDGGYYIPVGNCQGKIFEYNPSSGVSSVAAWASTNTSTVFYVSSAGAGILRDMGKTIVSSTRTFRKVQLVLPNSAATNGVAGNAPGGTNAYTSVGEDWLTGYIELGFGGSASAATIAPVAHYGR